MPYLVKDDLKTHIYSENLNEISRADDTIIQQAIDAAIAETKSYLSKYDTEKLFNTEASGYVDDANLKNKVKDIAVWHLVYLANPNIHFEVAEKRYDDAIKWLISVMKGQADPAGWPYVEDDATTAYNENGTISWTSNKQRNNDF